MLKLESINLFLAMLTLIDADIRAYNARIKSGYITEDTGSLRIKAMDCREKVYEKLEETYLSEISMEKVLKDLQRQ